MKKGRESSQLEILSNRKTLLAFCIILLLFTLTIFIGNRNHFAEQGTYSSGYLVLAKNLLAGNGYTYRIGTVEPAFYPIWGYPFLVALGIIIDNPNLFLLSLQFFLCVIGILCFYKLFEIKPLSAHIILFLPFIALMSVKWPDAIVGFCLITYLYFGHLYLRTSRIKFLFLSGLVLGIMVNFRSEYLYLSLFQLAVLFLPHLRGHRRDCLVYTATTFMISLVCLLPWAMRSYSYDSKLRFTSTNSGWVLYITLGQLPNNPWKIEYSDKAAFRYLNSMGGEKPYSIRGDKLLRKEFLSLLKEHPISYVRKVGHNFYSALKDGLYIGEYSTVFLSGGRWRKMIDYARRNGSIPTVEASSFKESLASFTQSTMNNLSRITLFALILLFICAIYSSRNGEKALLMGLSISIVAHRLALISLVQYIDRHMNAIYIILLGNALLAVPILNSTRKKWDLGFKRNKDGKLLQNK